MFDNITRAVITGATPLSGVNMERLPQELTAAYAKIVAFRVAEHYSDGFKAEVEKIERIGKTYLALLISCRNEHFQSIAFVAASAYSLVASYRNEIRSDVFDRDSVCPLCTSTLLYILADAVSDAAEVALRIPDIEAPYSTHDRISHFVRRLALGKLSEITQDTIPVPVEGSHDALATITLYNNCLIGLQKLCLALLGDDSSSFDAAIHILNRTKILAVEDISYNLEHDTLGVGIFSTFPGPFITSSLLSIAAERLYLHSLMNVPAPDARFADSWNEQIKKLSRSRPYIWPNHARAIHGNGVLRSGISAVFSLPTGAGKTTLSILKIASSLVAGGKVIFLAPTHALVQQVSNELRTTFPEYTVKNAVIDGEYVETEDAVLADIAVMTPERCLAFLMFYPLAFGQVRLVVFDECHILHASDWSHSYRASDSMMCLHRLFEHAPQADYFLLSAMVANTVDIAGWIAKRIIRPCYPIQDEWKPTRQVKGCIVYQKSDINSLNGHLIEDHNDAVKVSRKRPGSAVKEKLSIQPWAFFGLNQTWNTTKVIDYLALPISAKNAMLGANDYWKLSPNKNIVAASLATTLYNAGVKTLIFVQQINHTQSIVANIRKQTDANIKHTVAEQNLLLKIRDELGSLDISYTPQDGVAACHHGLLLKDERELVESLFRRPDGIGVLAATPTLAQGMNLPAEAVILAGDERWDVEQNNQESLEAHELLNAAGRAGRAGLSAKGFVLVIPKRVVSLEYSNNGGASIGKEWTELKDRTFSKSDQCLTVVDPLEKLLDSVQDKTLSDEAAAHYLFRRMPFREGHADVESIRDTLNNSLAAFVAIKKGQNEAFIQAVEATIEASHDIRDFDAVADTPWMGALATEIGVDTDVVAKIFGKLDGLDPEYNVYEYLDWANNSGILLLLSRPSSHSDIVNTLTTKQEKNQIAPHFAAYKRLVEGLKAWCGGSTLIELSKFMLETTKTKAYCKNSRKLAIKWAPEVAYALGSVARMYKYKCEAEGIPMPLCLATLASLIRHGMDSPEKLALLHIHDYQFTRRKTHNLYHEFADRVSLVDTYASFRDVLKAVKDAYHRHIRAEFDKPQT